jgi:hypothetical protein|nr:hypothetical protein [Aeromicrobium sp.]
MTTGRGGQPNPYTSLPPRVRLEDTIASQDSEPVPDPEGGRDTDRDFLIRYGFGI